MIVRLWVMLEMIDRYIAWVSGNFEERVSFQDNEILMEELYDYEIDPLRPLVLLLIQVNEIKDDMIRDLRSIVWSK